MAPLPGITKHDTAPGVSPRALLPAWPSVRRRLGRNRDPPCPLLGLRRFRQMDRKDAVRERSVAFILHYTLRQRQPPFEPAIETFGVTALAVFGFTLFFTADGQHIVVDREIDILFVHPGKFRQDADKS